MGEDWVVLSEKEDPATGTVGRRIVSFRKSDELYRRDYEVHRARLHVPEEIEAGRRGAGFEAATMDSYGDCPLGANHAAFVAREP